MEKFIKLCIKNNNNLLQINAQNKRKRLFLKKREGTNSHTFLIIDNAV